MKDWLVIDINHVLSLSGFSGVKERTEEITLGKVAEIAGVSMETMKRFLMKNGVRPRLGQTVEEARKDYLTIKEFLDERNRK